MDASITYLHKRNNISELPAKERKELLLHLINTDINLTPEEEKYLSNHEMKAYVGKLLQRSSSLTPYELNFTDDTEKDIYIMSDKRLELLFPIIHDLDEIWRRKIFTQAVFTNKGITDELFNSLTDTDKRFYVNLCIVNTAYLSATQLKYLSPKNQISIINQIIERGEDFSIEQIESFTKENQTYYRKKIKMKKELSEQVRKYIRKVINEAVSSSNTIFGPYSDETVLTKDEMKKPQYFNIALSKANQVCSNPEKTQDKLDCPYNYEIAKTMHSHERQFRHIVDTGEVIQDEQIKSLINKASDGIVKRYLSNAIILGDKIHLKDKTSDLNVIISIHSEKVGKDETIITFAVVTVMNNKNFFRGYDTKLTIVA